MRPISRFDAHVHSIYSGHGGEAWLAGLKLRECWTTPEQVYELALKRGMDFVTLTDHDTIEGALRLAHRQRFFISEEITAVFPEDRVPLHILAYHISEENHRMFRSLRHNVYELVRYLNDSEIIHALAHPFFRMGPPLSIAHIEKMFLLFERFEVRNGGKQLLYDSFLEDMLDSLTPEKIWQLADKHDIPPIGSEPWKKMKIGGSDDHGGILIGLTGTETPAADSVQDLLDHIRHGRSRAYGRGGSPLSVAHSIMAVAYHSVKDGHSGKGMREKILWNVLGQFFDNANPERKSLFSTSALLYLIQKLPPTFWNQVTPWNIDESIQVLWEKFREDKTLHEIVKNGLDFSEENHERLAQTAGAWIHDWIRYSIQKMESGVGVPLKISLAFTAILFIYLIALKLENNDKRLMREAASVFPTGEIKTQDTCLVFTDGSSREVVEPFLRKWISPKTDRIRVIGLSAETIHHPERKNFTPLDHVHVGPRSIAVPPVMDIVRYLFEHDIACFFIQTLGPIGLTGLLIGKWMGMETTVRFPSGESSLLPLNGTWGGLDRFILSLADRIVVTSESDYRQVVSLSIPESKLLFPASETTKSIRKGIEQIENM